MFRYHLLRTKTRFTSCSLTPSRRAMLRRASKTFAAFDLTLVRMFIWRPILVLRSDSWHYQNLCETFVSCTWSFYHLLNILSQTLTSLETFVLLLVCLQSSQFFITSSICFLDVIITNDGKFV